MRSSYLWYKPLIMGTSDSDRNRYIWSGQCRGYGRSQGNPRTIYVHSGKCPSCRSHASWNSLRCSSRIQRKYPESLRLPERFRADIRMPDSDVHTRRKYDCTYGCSPYLRALSNQSGFIMDGGLILHPFKIQNLHNLPAGICDK